MTPGEIIRRRRKEMGLTLRGLAARVAKANGEPISPSYLHDVEMDRRLIANPAIIRSLADALGIAPEVLWYGTLPEVLRVREDAEPDQIVRAFEAFRQEIEERTHLTGCVRDLHGIDECLCWCHRPYPG